MLTPIRQVAQTAIDRKICSCIVRVVGVEVAVAIAREAPEIQCRRVGGRDPIDRLREVPRHPAQGMADFVQESGYAFVARPKVGPDPDEAVDRSGRCDPPSLRLARTNPEVCVSRRVWIVKGWQILIVEEAGLAEGEQIAAELRVSQVNYIVGDIPFGNALVGQDLTIVIPIADFDPDGDVIGESVIQDFYRGCLIVDEVLRSIGIVVTDDIHGAAVPLGVVLFMRTTPRSPIRTLKKESRMTEAPVTTDLE
jgi:hypothetical protein